MNLVQRIRPYMELYVYDLYTLAIYQKKEEEEFREVSLVRVFHVI